LNPFKRLTPQIATATRWLILDKKAGAYGKEIPTKSTQINAFRSKRVIRRMQPTPKTEVFKKFLKKQ
jgi:hypothetical protein